MAGFQVSIYGRFWVSTEVRLGMQIIRPNRATTPSGPEERCLERSPRDSTFSSL